MREKENLKKDIENIWLILAGAKKCYQYTEYLHNASTESERIYINLSDDFRFIRHILWRTTIIELSKLFNHSGGNDQFTINKLIIRLKPNGSYAKMNINSAIIDLWENKIDEYKDIIRQILLLRKKVYAHTDIDRVKFLENEITFEAIEELIKLVEEIISVVYNSIFDSLPDFSSYSFDKSTFDIIKILAEEKENRIKEIMKKSFNPKN